MGVCKKCHYCCKYISLYYKAQPELDEWLQTRGLKLVQKGKTINEWSLYAPCPHLDKKLHCKIYGSRPQACRLYPIVDLKKWTNEGIDFLKTMPAKCGYREDVDKLQKEASSGQI